MPKLILSADNKFIEEILIDKDKITIGRHVENDVYLDNLAISGYHLQITTNSNNLLLEDLNSTNGTLVNSKFIKKHILKNGDLINIGDYRIKYINNLASKYENSEEVNIIPSESNHDKIDASIADLVEQIDTNSNANYIENSSKSIEEIENL